MQLRVFAVRRWYSSVNGTPGFTEESFRFIKNLVEDQTFAVALLAYKILKLKLNKHLFSWIRAKKEMENTDCLFLINELSDESPIDGSDITIKRSWCGKKKISKNHYYKNYTWSKVI